jgi:hypothetical protein
MVAGPELELNHGPGGSLDLLRPELAGCDVVDWVHAYIDNVDIDGCIGGK